MPEKISFSLVQFKSGVTPLTSANIITQADLGSTTSVTNRGYVAILGDGDRTGPQMLTKQPPKLALTHAYPVGQGLQIIPVQRPKLDQGQGARHGIGRPAPSAKVRRGFWPTAQTGPKSSLLSGRSRLNKDDIFRLGRAGRTDGAAIDARGLDADKDPPVKTRIADQQGSVLGIVIKGHGAIWR